MTARKVIGYMDKVSWEEELGNAKGGEKVYPSAQDLQECCPCVKECGVVEVEVRLKKVIRETCYDFSKAKPTKDWTAKDKQRARSRARQHAMKRVAMDMLRFTPGQKRKVLEMALAMAAKTKKVKS